MITVIHENNPDIRIRRVLDLVVGKWIKNYMFFFSCEKLSELKESCIFENKAKNCGCVLNSFYFFTGRVRTSLTPPPLGEGSLHTVSLNVLSPQVQSHPDENKSVFRLEAAWDSSLHNSILLNRYS